jgi:probable phosphoglycerate mutase
LPELLRSRPIARIYSSPLERARETAEPLARARELDVTIDDALTEVDFGSWTGMTFDELARLPEWVRFNARRSIAEVPAGERPVDVQARIVSALDRLRAQHQGQTVAVVSHADVIRAAVLHYAGASLDMVHRIEISPASVTGVALGGRAPRLLFVNHRELAA